MLLLVEPGITLRNGIRGPGEGWAAPFRLVPDVDSDPAVDGLSGPPSLPDLVAAPRGSGGYPGRVQAIHPRLDFPVNLRYPPQPRK